MSSLFVSTGECHLGVNGAEAKFTPGGDNSSVVIVSINPETMEPEGEASVYGDWQASRYLKSILEELHPHRIIDIPPLENIVKKAYKKDGIDLCDYCDDYQCCRDCIINEWKTEVDHEDA